MDVTPIDRLSGRQTEDLVTLYQNEWWSKGRTLEGVREMLKNSDLVFGLEEAGSGRLVGFTRVLTDFVFRATIYDVIVSPDARGHDLGRRLMDAVMADRRLAKVASVELHCLPPMKAFYAKWGFAPNSFGTETMRLRRDDAPVITELAR